MLIFLHHMTVTPDPEFAGRCITIVNQFPASWQHELQLKKKQMWVNPQDVLCYLPSRQVVGKVDSHLSGLCFYRQPSWRRCEGHLALSQWLLWEANRCVSREQRKVTAESSLSAEQRQVGSKNSKQPNNLHLPEYSHLVLLTCRLGERSAGIYWQRVEFLPCSAADLGTDWFHLSFPHPAFFPLAPKRACSAPQGPLDAWGDEVTRMNMGSIRSLSALYIYDEMSLTRFYFLRRWAIDLICCRFVDIRMFERLQQGDVNHKSSLLRTALFYIICDIKCLFFFRNMLLIRTVGWWGSL